MRISLTARAGTTDTVALWLLSDAVFADQPDKASWRAMWDRHSARDGFRLALAHDGDTLVGFGYGHTGEPGQWWTDRAAEVLDETFAREWLGGHFELVSIGVLERCRGRGVGRGLLTALTAGLPHERLLLMTTADATDPARRLYASDGWEVIGPGLSDVQVIMGKRG